LDCFHFWSIGAEENLMMDVIYKSEERKKKLKKLIYIYVYNYVIG
jgi:hypothetical protein